jgi:hypothetical protein
MRTFLVGIFSAVVLLAPASAGAINTEGHALPYGLLGGVYEFEDSDRESDNGLGFFGGVGFPLSSRPGEALEVSFHRLERERNIDGRDDYQYSLFAHWVRDLTPPPAYGDVRPFLLVGVGAIQEDVRGDDHLHAGLDAGLGALFPLPLRGWAIRGEALAQAQLNDESVPDEDYLLDFHLRLSLQIPLDFFPTPAPPELPPAQDCPTRVVDPVSGRSDCLSDSDRDGVADGQDQCPGTPTGTAVDAQGCTVAGVLIDSDDDGVLDDVDGAARGAVRDRVGTPDRRRAQRPGRGRAHLQEPARPARADHRPHGRCRQRQLQPGAVPAARRVGASVSGWQGRRTAASGGAGPG